MNKNELLRKMFYPASICIAGASTKKLTIGYELLNNIIKGGYGGTIFPINPKAGQILGLKCYTSINELKEIPDMAIVVLPKKVVPEGINLLLEKGVKSIILITAGFKETGKEGEDIEQEIVRKVKKQGAILAGPNCMGIINTDSGTNLNATIVARKSGKSKLGFLSQSGAIGAAVLNSMSETNINFSQFISLGNKADLNENDILQFWQDDENISVIAAYLESIEDGKCLIEIVTHNLTKPLILLKAGKTEAGQKAAVSHTGALGTSDKVVNSVCNQFGMIRVNNLNEMFNTAKGFEYFTMPMGNKVAIVTNAGGPAILLTDKIEEKNLELSRLSNETKEKLKAVVHSQGSLENPVDLLPGADAENYKKVIEILMNDKNVDSVVSIFVEPVMVKAIDVVESVNKIEAEKPLFQVVMPLPEFWLEYDKPENKKYPVFRNPEDPAEIISNMLKFRKREKSSRSIKSLFGERRNKINRIKHNGLIGIPDIEEILVKYNVPLIKSTRLSFEDLEKMRETKYPVVLKGISKTVTHKSDIGAVKVDLKNREELLQASKEIADSLKKRNILLEEFVLQQYIKPSYELLLGGFRDRTFGPMIMFGSGGKLVEVLGDIQIRSALISDKEITTLIKSTIAGKILEGVRGDKASDFAEIAAIIRSVAEMMLENPGIKEFDINPLIKTEEGKFVAVDFRLLWKE